MLLVCHLRNYLSRLPKNTSIIISFTNEITHGKLQCVFWQNEKNWNKVEVVWRDITWTGSIERCKSAEWVVGSSQPSHKSATICFIILFQFFSPFFFFSSHFVPSHSWSTPFTLAASSSYLSCTFSQLWWTCSSGCTIANSILLHLLGYMYRPHTTPLPFHNRH